MSLSRRNPTGLYPVNIFPEDYPEKMKIQKNSFGPSDIDWSRCYQQHNLEFWRGYTGAKYLGKEQQGFTRKLYNTHMGPHLPSSYQTFPEIRDYKFYKDNSPGIPFNFIQLQNLRKSEIFLENQRDIFKLDTKSKIWRYDARDHRLI